MSLHLEMIEDFPEKCYPDVIKRISVMETKLDNVISSLNDLKQGIGFRVEEAGKNIAVLQEQFKETGKRVDGLETSRTYFVVAILGAFLTSLWGMVTGKK